MQRESILFDVDSYKVSHFKQYPPGTAYVSSYIESRGGRWDKTVFFGLQMFLKDVMSKPITMEDIDEAEAFYPSHGLPFNRAGWEHILRQHNGYLPVIIEAVQEGTVVPTGNVLLQLQNTDPMVPWLTSYVETALLRAIWYPTTVATNSWMIKQDIKARLAYTGCDVDANIGFMLNDFGSRGATSYESSVIGGIAHLVNFVGTDNVPAVRHARRYYSEPMAGFSIPAAEHSTITTWEKEVDAFENMLDQFNGEGKMVAVVSDSYNIYDACKELWGKKLKDKVMNGGGRVVIRPDSGNPLNVPVECVSLLMDAFGYTTNEAGFRVLPPYIRVIQGDGVDQDSINGIMKHLIDRGHAIENVCFGMGGALLQQVNRDTQMFAQKASAIQISGHWHDVFKKPIGDIGKISKRGVLSLIENDDGTLETVRHLDAVGKKKVLTRVYKNGKILSTQNLSQIRANSEK